MSVTRLVRAESRETTFGSFAPGNVDNYIKPIELYIDHLAAQTQTPVYYLKGRLANLSADAMHAADQGLVDRVNGKILAYSDPWEEIMRTAFLAINDQKRGRVNLIRHLLEQERSIFGVGLAGVGDELGPARNVAHCHHAGDDDCLVTRREPSVLQEAIGDQVGYLHLVQLVAVSLGQLAGRRRFNDVACLLYNPHVAGNLQGQCSGRQR